MGQNISLKCSCCDYEIGISLGVGFFFPMLYEETIKEIKEGKLGKTLYRFLEEHPDGAVDCERAVLQCDTCGALKQGMNFSMYIPKPGFVQSPHSEWSGAFPCEGLSYVAKSDLKESYNLYQHYPHRCPRCRKRMIAMNTEEFMDKLNNQELLCPDCKSKLEMADMIMWD